MHIHWDFIGVITKDLGTFLDFGYILLEDLCLYNQGEKLYAYGYRYIQRYNFSR